ncbi:hypothetical protein BO221_22355 [Archangium sp. Cb G35]|uniref:hypothetical protein n=1 Tax=Archangium sp. Cb G35 TaxID=1920190 RepID=UPI0009363983|nr:hypothetical protein [Archangium sp. Cb G35]OJT22515.1 hypothetical protein BO221_22355 [Archangium sp. Cb G35]
MNRKTFAVLPGLFALLALAACSSSSKSTPSSTTDSEPAVQGKMQAPVVVNVQFEDSSSARITVRFDAPATGVRVEARGLDGLVVIGRPTLAHNVNFPRDTTATYDVLFTPGAGRSHLAVSVSGEFKGAQLSRVATFAIGTPTDSQRSSNATKAEGAEGERIKVMPADTQ